MNGEVDRPLAIIETDRLRASFELVDGQIRHAIWTTRGESWTRLLESAPALADDVSDGLPVFSQLHQQTAEDGSPAVLAVGMVARDHWSMSAVADRSTGQIVFDMACRLQAQQSPLRVAYTVARGVSVDVGDRCVLLTHPASGRYQLKHVPVEPGVEDSPWQSSAPDRLESSRAPIGSGPQTLRWLYAVAPAL